MAIKLILTDIDGTIMPYGKRQVTQRCRAAFHAAMDAGILVGPASGRFFSWIPSFFGGDKACCQTALATNGMQVYLEGRKVLVRLDGKVFEADLEGQNQLPADVETFILTVLKDYAYLL